MKKNVAAKVRPHKGGTEQAWLASLSAEQRKSIPRPYLSPGELVEPDARRVQKQASDRAHEARRSRARVKTSSRKRTAKPTGEQSWEALLTGPEYTGVFEPVTAADRYMALELRAIANRVLGDGNPGLSGAAEAIFRAQREHHPGEATREELAAVRAAYVAANRWPIEAEWQRKLHREMAAAVARRLQKSRLRKAVMYGARTGSEVLRRLRPMYGTPKALSATKLDAIIRATTVGPGGKGRRNVRHVVDEYIRELGHDPFDPAPPFSRKK